MLSVYQLKLVGYKQMTNVNVSKIWAADKISNNFQIIPKIKLQSVARLKYNSIFSLS